MIYRLLKREKRVWNHFRYLGIFIFLTGFLLFKGNVHQSFAKEKISISGITEALRDITMGLSVQGRVSRIFLKEGSTVRKGECILELNKRLEALEVERRKLIWESKVELEAAKTQVLTSKSILDSNQKLFENTRSISREELEKMKLEYKLAVAEQERLKTEEERQRIEYEMALESLRKRRLESPINGIIIRLLLDEGESYEPEQPIVRVVDVSRCLLVCNIDEPFGRNLKKGQIIDLRLKTGPESVIRQGTIVFVSPVVEPASGLLEVKTEFENRDGLIRPGVAGFMLLEKE